MNTLSQPFVQAASLRWLITADLPAVLQIAEDCQGPQWDDEDLEECFRSVDTIGKVVEVEGQVVCFLIYQLDRDAQEVVVKSLCVAPEWRRRGVGRGIIASLDRKLTQGYDRITFMVPEGNLPLQLLLRDAGFRAVRVHRRWYGDEDAYRMEKGKPRTEG
jgi:ribosomal protein S18 acetylase RimI-like enzyme